MELIREEPGLSWDTHTHTKYGSRYAAAKIINHDILMTPKYTRLNDLITHTLGSAPAEPQPSEVVSTINAH